MSEFSDHDGSSGKSDFVFENIHDVEELLMDEQLSTNLPTKDDKKLSVFDKRITFEEESACSISSQEIVDIALSSREGTMPIKINYTIGLRAKKFLQLTNKLVRRNGSIS